MLDHEDLKWLVANATELNHLLQQAKREAEQIHPRKGEGGHLDSLDEELERSLRTAQAILNRITKCLPSNGSGGAPVAPPASLSTIVPGGEIALAADTGSDSLIINPKGERELILLVDDDLEIIQSTGEILDFEDYRIITAKDGIEALWIYRRMGKRIDLVLLDYFLPIVDGDAVFDELKAINPDVRVVLSSGFAEQAKVNSMLARGLCGFVPKPYTHEKLVDQIRTVLDA